MLALSSRLPLAARPALSALFAACLALGPLAAAEPPAKDHTVFVGLDVAIARQGKYHRVVGAAKDAVQIMVDRSLVTVPLSEVKDLRIDRGVKLSNLSAGVTDLKGALIDGSKTSDAEAVFNAMAVEAEMANRLADASRAQSYSGETGASYNPDTSIGAQGSEAPAASISELESNITRAAGMRQNVISDARPEGSLSASGFGVSFVVSAPRPLVNAYAIILVDCISPGSEKVLSRISVQPLGTLSQTRQKIARRIGGFPEGAQLKGYQVAVFSHGQEVATNVSSRRMAVTREEALLFLTMDYLAKHPGETLPPVPVLMVPRSEFAAQLGSTPVDVTVHAKIGKDGSVTQISTDASGRAPLPAELIAAVGNIAFVPALEKGKPVDGTLKLKLADLLN